EAATRATHAPAFRRGDEQIVKPITGRAASHHFLWNVDDDHAAFGINDADKSTSRGYRQNGRAARLRPHIHLDVCASQVPAFILRIAQAYARAETSIRLRLHVAPQPVDADHAYALRAHARGARTCPTIASHGGELH